MPLIAHFPMDEDSGTTVEDVSGNNNDATRSGSTIGQPGINGTTCYDFASLGDYYDTPTMPTLSGMGTFSVSLWVNPDVTDGTFDGAISYAAADFIIYNSDTNDWEYWLLDDGSAATRQIIGPPVETGTWTHLVAGWDGTTQFLYVNGEPFTQQPTMNALSSTSSNWRIGERSDANFPFDGQIDDVRIYDHALTNAEANEIFTSAYSGDYTSSVQKLE